MRNTGQSSLRRKRRGGDVMRAYDALPGPLRRWLSEARLPWSPQSVRRIWVRSIKAGKSPEEALQRLDDLERRNLQRDWTVRL